MEKQDLMNRIYCWMENPEENALRTMFTLEEWNILCKITELERLRTAIWGQIEESEIKTIDVERVYQGKEQEREVSIALKEACMHQINFLLFKGTIEAWSEIMVWQALLKGKNFIVDKFWEFPVLKVVCDVFAEELKDYLKDSTPISVLSLHNMQDLTDAYFKTVFLCRRIEYGVEPIDEIADYIKEKKFSPVFVCKIIEASQLGDKNGIMDTIKNMCWR